MRALVAPIARKSTNDPKSQFIFIHTKISMIIKMYKNIYTRYLAHKACTTACLGRRSESDRACRCQRVGTWSAACLFTHVWCVRCTVLCKIRLCNGMQRSRVRERIIESECYWSEQSSTRKRFNTNEKVESAPAQPRLRRQLRWRAARHFAARWDEVRPAPSRATENRRRRRPMVWCFVDIVSVCIFARLFVLYILLLLFFFFYIYRFRLF